MERICRIYTLAHPISGEVRYVGKTVETLHKRWGKHCTHFVSNNYRENWIKSIIKLGLRPVIELIEEVDDSISSETEMFWIAQFKQWGFRLINATDGGEGSVGFKHTEESKKKLSEIAKARIRVYGRTHTEESKLRISNSRSGVRVSEHGKSNISKGKIGRVPISPVIKVDTNTRYRTIKEAALDNNITPSMLSKKLRRGDTDYKYDVVTQEDIDIKSEKFKQTMKLKDF